MKFRKPDENVGIIEKPAERSEFEVRVCFRVFRKNYAQDIGARRANNVLKRWHKVGKYAGVQFQQDVFAGRKSQSVHDSPRAFVVICRVHFCKWSLIAATRDGIVDSTGMMSGFKPNSWAASRVTGPITARDVLVGNE